jgi:hypothetical protein
MDEAGAPHPDGTDADAEPDGMATLPDGA